MQIGNLIGLYGSILGVLVVGPAPPPTTRLQLCNGYQSGIGKKMTTWIWCEWIAHYLACHCRRVIRILYSNIHATCIREEAERDGQESLGYNGLLSLVQKTKVLESLGY